MQVVYLIFTLICSAGAVFIYRLGVEDGKKHCDTLYFDGRGQNPSPTRTTGKKQSKEISAEDKKLKEGIANILSYGLGGED